MLIKPFNTALYFPWQVQRIYLKRFLYEFYFDMYFGNSLRVTLVMFINDKFRIDKSMCLVIISVRFASLYTYLIYATRT